MNGIRVSAASDAHVQTSDLPPVYLPQAWSLEKQLGRNCSTNFSAVRGDRSFSGTSTVRVGISHRITGHVMGRVYHTFSRTSGRSRSKVGT